MSEFAVFGDPARFEIRVRWRADADPPSRRPAAHGWSLGDLQMTVAGETLTRSRSGGRSRSHITWYLAPFFDWLARNWAPLLHEEDFAWSERSAAPAVVACHRALDRWIGAGDAEGLERYRECQAWYGRHALRSAAEGGLFPDLFLRRFLDDIEVSWSSSPPLFAPDGFAFVAEPGVARLSVEEVGATLWEALTWAASVPPAGEESTGWRSLSQRIGAIPDTMADELERAYVDGRVLDVVRAALDRARRPDLVRDDVSAARPYITALSPAVLMFGGVSPDLGRRDVERLCQLLVDRSNGRDGARLGGLLSSRSLSPLGIPHEDGYAFAEDLVGDLGMVDESGWIDVRAIAAELEIPVLEEALDTDTIRGVAMAGQGFDPAILVNTTSVFNRTEYGRRFTIAHELCHVLHDRTRARRITHVSGPWAAPGIERRANAFAAYLLMPRHLVLRHWRAQPAEDAAAVTAAAQSLHVNESALVEHLYNLEIVDEVLRERLRVAFRQH